MQSNLSILIKHLKIIKKLTLLTILGDPCGHPEKIPKDASELSCGSDGKLVGASLSNKGHVVIGLMQEGQPR